MSEPEDQSGPAPLDPWSGLRRYTEARVALGLVGASLPTREVLNFSMARARACDAVHCPLDIDELSRALAAEQFAVLRAQSLAVDRLQYLARPDLGRRLDPPSRSALAAPGLATRRLTVVLADGLSAQATARYALPLLLEVRARLSGWDLDSIIVASQARVALADEIGELRHAEAVAILLGERPGLTAPDSLGLYMTYLPRPGRTDAERNCISNVRQNGLSPQQAAKKLLQLLNQARIAGSSGVVIKDRGDDAPPPLPLMD